MYMNKHVLIQNPNMYAREWGSSTKGSNSYYGPKQVVKGKKLSKGSAI